VAAPVTRRELAGGAQPLLAGKRVLIVDDNDTNRRILTLQTQKWGLRPRDTASPHEALAWVRRGDAFDVAILDMHMPEMDGLALGTEIRQHRDPANLPLVLFTSLGRREGATGSLLFAAHLTKPIKPSALYDALVSVFASRAEPGGPQPQPEEPARRAAAAQHDPHLAERHPLRLLLAEDNAVNQKLALRLLQQMGYRADVAANGLEAIAAVERQPYDVILMDVQMPEMDGLEATRQIVRRWPGRGARPRIIAMTANAMPGDREMCLAAGMDDYLTKPIRVEALVSALLLSQPRVEPGKPSAMNEPLIDTRVLEELVANTDAGFVRELLDTYLDDSPRLLDELRTGLSANSAETVRRAAHSLKSNSASVGALGLSAHAKALELEAKAGQLQGAAARIDEIAASYALVAEVLRAWTHA
jgi:CheY-like chemotaxis protein/HPt (histidine-containing phosphotransfer) domain-containing protein